MTSALRGVVRKLDRFRRYPGDPWKRVAEESREANQVLENYKAGKPRTRAKLPRKITDSDLKNYLFFVTEPKYAMQEMLAFLAAWRGSIELQRSSGNLNLVKKTMPPDDAEKALTIIVKMKKQRLQYAGYVDRLFYRSLASDLKAGRMTSIENGKVVPKSEARRIVVHAREYGWL